MTNIIQLEGRTPMLPGHKVARYLVEEKPRTHSPVMISLVGQREGRLSERFPARHHRAAQADISMGVQGNPLSHLFSFCSAFKLHQFANAVFEVFKALLLSLMCLFGVACIAGSILSLLFFAFI